MRRRTDHHDLDDGKERDMRRWMTMLLVMLAGDTAISEMGTAGQLRIVVVNHDGDSLPCRIHLYDKAGRPQRAGHLPFWRDHFVCSGQAKLSLPAGEYRVEIERGPEYEQHTASFKLDESGEKELSVCLKRIADLAADGWYGGDLHVHRAIEDMPLLMQAEDLHVAPVITWWNNRNLWSDRPAPEDPLVQVNGNRYYHVMAGEDEREGGALMFFNRGRFLPITGSSREYPSPMKFVNQARGEGDVWIDIEKPFWWDVPVWLASGKIDSVGLANNHMCRSQMYESEAWGRPRDARRLPPPRGNGYWTQEIYYHMLNCGLRVPPSAGSASGVLPNPLGYNRVYVYCGDDFSYDAWWRGLKVGRSFVTNGPLLLAKANGQLPGHVFTTSEGERVEIDLEVSVTSRDRIAAVEIVKNGKIECTADVAEGSPIVKLDELVFHRSGWFLVRAIADVQHTYRFASTAPYHVEVGSDKRHISRRSAQFFLDWVGERIARVPQKLQDADKLAEVLAHHEQARRFWPQVLAKANAE
jgi:hypothetical protein